MRSESVVFTVAGMCFGIILGWVMGMQQAHGTAPVVPVQAAAPVAQAPVLDEARVQSLTAIISSDATNAGARVQLANEYYDAELFDQAIAWYQQALAIDPSLVDASTDLAVSYYYTGETDRALAQFEYSLALDPVHTKTLLNKGIVLAFGRQDITSAAEVWRQVVELSPDSPEGQTASQALQSMTSAEHATAGTPAP
jgi:tetratricopeptide (TPR) repeat protein